MITQGKPFRRRDRSYLQVGTEHAGRRIDNFLRFRLGGLQRSRLYRILRRGEVRVNRCRVQPDYRLQEGDWIRIPPVYERDRPPSRPVGAELSRRLEHSVLHEENGLLVLNKPAGLAVHGGTGLQYNLLSALRTMRSEELELVHRLDRDTSGCLLLCSDVRRLRKLHGMFRQHRVQKIYYALLAGHPPAQLQIDLPLKRVPGRGAVRQVVVASGGRPARSQLRICRRFALASLVQLQACTGRTHQLRMHVSAIGHPLAGDQRYGDWEFNRQMRMLGLHRMFLHAAVLKLPAIDEDEVALSFQAPLPAELEHFLQRLSAYRERSAPRPSGRRRARGRR